MAVSKFPLVSVLFCVQNEHLVGVNPFVRSPSQHCAPATLWAPCGARGRAVNEAHVFPCGTTLCWRGDGRQKGLVRPPCAVKARWVGGIYPHLDLRVWWLIVPRGKDGLPPFAR